MRFLVSMVFVGMLALSSQAFAEAYYGEDANRIMVRGEVVASNWVGEYHHTRIIYDKTLYACVTSPPENSRLKYLWSACWDFKPPANQ